MKVFLGPLCASLAALVTFYLVNYFMNNLNDNTSSAGVGGAFATFLVLSYQIKKKQALVKRA